MKQKNFRTGKHSICIVIPSSFSHALGIKGGDCADVETDVSTGKMTIRFTGVKQLRLPVAKRRQNERK